MELIIVEQSKNRVVIDIKGEGHSLCNALKHELQQDETVKSAGYFIEHPELNVPRMVIETKQGNSPKTAIVNAIKKLRKQNEKFYDLVKEEVK
ncbi:DNA-directed RNA polymerase subunit L [Candidatus Woesearchaeota archaeon]|nr:DNA-directed RNA polymerase subunit L [Candidatus Woesearchaeota archaeon]